MSQRYITKNKWHSTQFSFCDFALKIANPSDTLDGKYEGKGRELKYFQLHIILILMPSYMSSLQLSALLSYLYNSTQVRNA